MVRIDAGVGNGDIQHAESKTNRRKDGFEKDARCQDSIEQSTHCGEEDGHRIHIRLSGVRQGANERRSLPFLPRAELRGWRSATPLSA
jgi:hypothetical protein